MPSSVKYSPFLYSFNSPDCKLTIETNIVARIIMSLKKDANGSRKMEFVKRVVTRCS